jgi:hypothetical protein
MEKKIKRQILFFKLLKDGESQIVKPEDKTRLVVTVSDRWAHNDLKNRKMGLERLKKI